MSFSFAENVKNLGLQNARSKFTWTLFGKMGPRRVDASSGAEYKENKTSG